MRPETLETDPSFMVGSWDVLLADGPSPTSEKNCLVVSVCCSYHLGWMIPSDAYKIDSLKNKNQTCYPVVNGGSDKRSGWGIHIPNKYYLENGEPRSCFEFPNHLIACGYVDFWLADAVNLPMSAHKV